MKANQHLCSGSRACWILLHVTSIAKHGRWHRHLPGIAREVSFPAASA
jgi:hypothetical protein